MERKTKTTIERGLLISGIAIAAFGLLTEGINYPWGTLVGKETIAADPAPVSEQWIEQSLPAEEDLVYLTDCDAYGTAATAPEEALQVGVIKLPKLGTADNVVEGTELKDLALGAGHLAGSALPGASGNCADRGRPLRPFDASFGITRRRGYHPARRPRHAIYLYGIPGGNGRAY